MSEETSTKAESSNTNYPLLNALDDLDKLYFENLNPDEKVKFLKNMEAAEEKRKIRLEKQEKIYNEDMGYLRRYFPSSIEGIIIKLDAYDYDNPKSVISSFKYYKRKTGVNALDEDTLILADDDNNSYLVFIKEDGEVITKHIGPGICIMETYKYGRGSEIRNRHEPTRIPKHLKSLIIINNTTINNTIGSMVNNFNALKISEPSSFLEKNYKRWGMYPLREMKKHPEWRKEYRNMLEVKRINICKSCKKRWLKGCCINYSQTNRVQIMMVIGSKK
jgi:hypothetical protein